MFSVVYCKFGCQYQSSRLPGKTRLRIAWLCVEWDVELYTLDRCVSLEESMDSLKWSSCVCICLCWFVIWMAVELPHIISYIQFTDRCLSYVELSVVYYSWRRVITVCGVALCDIFVQFVMNWKLIVHLAATVCVCGHYSCGLLDVCTQAISLKTTVWLCHIGVSVAVSLLWYTDYLTLSPPIPLRLYILPYWSNPSFLIFDIWVLWRSGLSARAPKCQKLKMMG